MREVQKITRTVLVIAKLQELCSISANTSRIGEWSKLKVSQVKLHQMKSNASWKSQFSSTYLYIEIIYFNVQSR